MVHEIGFYGFSQLLQSHLKVGSGLPKREHESLQLLLEVCVVCSGLTRLFHERISMFAVHGHRQVSYTLEIPEHLLKARVWPGYLFLLPELDDYGLEFECPDPLVQLDKVLF